jgi:hypothetical protein
MSQAVIFGSAADPATRANAHDIDVVYIGDRPDDLVTAWARERGLSHLPIDWHPYQSWPGRGIPVPAPYGLQRAVHPLTPETSVEWVNLHGLSAAIRAKVPFPAYSRLTVVPAPQSNPGPDWLAYVEGLTSLRSAVAKSRNPTGMEKMLTRHYGPLIGRLLDEDPRPTSSALQVLQAGSPIAANGAVIVRLGKGHIVLPYDPSADLESLLFG